MVTGRYSTSATMPTAVPYDVDLFDPAAGAQDDRRRVACSCEFDLEASTVGVAHPGAHDGDELFGALVVHHLVQRTQQRVWPPVEIPCRADALASPARQCGRLDALAAHVADQRAASRRRNRGRRRSRHRCPDARPQAGIWPPARRRGSPAGRAGAGCSAVPCAMRPRSSYRRAESSATAAWVAMRSASATSSRSKPLPLPRINTRAPSVVPRAVRPTPRSSAGRIVAASAASPGCGIIVARPASASRSRTTRSSSERPVLSTRPRPRSSTDIFETTPWKPASSPPTTVNAPGRLSGTTTMAQSASLGRIIVSSRRRRTAQVERARQSCGHLFDQLVAASYRAQGIHLEVCDRRHPGPIDGHSTRLSRPDPGVDSQRDAPVESS